MRLRFYGIFLIFYSSEHSDKIHVPALQSVRRRDRVGCTQKSGTLGPASVDCESNVCQTSAWRHGLRRQPRHHYGQSRHCRVRFQSLHLQKIVVGASPKDRLRSNRLRTFRTANPVRRVLGFLHWWTGERHLFQGKL